MNTPYGISLQRAAFYLLLFTALSWMHLALPMCVFDDAYIHFRIAENLLKFGKPYFNTDEAVMASSSSGWTLLLYALFLLAGAGLKAVALYNSAVTAMCVYVYSGIVREATGREGVSADMLTSLVILPVTVYSSIGLMETPTALLLLGAGALLYLRHSAVSFMLLAAGVFFRPELAVFLLLFAVAGIYTRNVPLRKSGLSALLGAAPFIIYNHVYFGTDIPHTIKAKSLVFVITPAEAAATGFPAWLDAGVAADRAALLAVLVIATLVAYITIRTALKNRGCPKDRALLLLSGGGVLVFLAYVARKVYILEWYNPIYFVPLFMAALVCALYRRPRALGALLGLALVPFVFNFGRAACASVVDNSCYPGIHDIARARKYLEVGRRLYARYPGYSLMSSEIGGLGYGFKGRIYDGVGLISDGPLKYHPMKVPGERLSGFIATVPAGYAEEVRPDIIVGYGHHLHSILLSDISRDYIIIKEQAFAPQDMFLADADFMRNINLYVMIRKDRYTKGY